MTRKCILLVDDEPAILEAMRRRFRALRRQWEIVTASGGHAAMAVLEARTVDVIVTDMRMPDLPGGDLLERARGLQPSALRIVLSGQLDVENEAVSTPFADHCLSKPFAVEGIVDIIERARAGSESGGLGRDATTSVGVVT